MAPKYLEPSSMWWDVYRVCRDVYRVCRGVYPCTLGAGCICAAGSI